MNTRAYDVIRALQLCNESDIKSLGQLMAPRVKVYTSEDDPLFDQEAREISEDLIHIIRMYPYDPEGKSLLTECCGKKPMLRTIVHGHVEFKCRTCGSRSPAGLTALDVAEGWQERRIYEN